MKAERFQRYVTDTIALLKEQALKARNDSKNAGREFNCFTEGVLMGYYSIITRLKHQTLAFNIDQKEFGLADIEPERDLLGLHRNPDIGC